MGAQIETKGNKARIFGKSRNWIHLRRFICVFGHLSGRKVKQPIGPKFIKIGKKLKSEERMRKITAKVVPRASATSRG